MMIDNRGNIKNTYFKKYIYLIPYRYNLIHQIIRCVLTYFETHESNEPKIPIMQIRALEAMRADSHWR